MSRGKKHRQSRRDDIRARKAQRRASARESQRTGIFITLMGLPMLAVGVGMLWFAVVSMRRGYIDVSGPGMLYVHESPFAFHLSNVLTAAVGLFSAAMSLETMRGGRREARRAKAGAAHASTRR